MTRPFHFEKRGRLQRHGTGKTLPKVKTPPGFPDRLPAMDDDSQATKFPLPLSPMTRLSMAFTEELKRDTGGLLASLKDKYIGRLAVAEHKRDMIFRSAFIIDAALAFLISGQNFKIPVLGISAIEIPAIVEAATLTSAIAVVFATVQFITWAAYDMILRQYGNAAAGVVHSAGEQAGKHAIDPDFFNAAESHVELALKLLRIKFNNFGPDYYEPGKAFRVYSAAVHGLIYLLFVLFPLVHWLLTGLSLYATYSAHGFGVVTGVYFLTVLVLNLLAILIWVGTYKDFHFVLDFTKAPWKPQAR